MDWYNTKVYKVYVSVLTAIADFNWNKLKELLTGRRYYDLTDDDLAYLRNALGKNYYIILSRRKTVLSTYLIGIATFIKTGKFGYYDHALLNLEDGDPSSDDKFQLLEATAAGCHIATFMEVFNCDSVALLRPKNMVVQEWEDVVEEAKKEIGKPYDDLFNINDDTHVSCVELVRTSLKAIPNYDEKFPNFEKEIAKVGNLTPQMYYDSEDFEIVWEVRR